MGKVKHTRRSQSARARVMLRLREFGHPWSVISTFFGMEKGAVRRAVGRAGKGAALNSMLPSPAVAVSPPTTGLPCF